MGLFDETISRIADNDRWFVRSTPPYVRTFFEVIRSFCHGNDYDSSFENAVKNIISIDFGFLAIVTKTIFEEKMKRIKKKKKKN